VAIGFAAGIAASDQRFLLQDGALFAASEFSTNRWRWARQIALSLLREALSFLFLVQV
jgi:hypothetical protein